MLSQALEPGERVLAAAALPDGEMLAATRFGLWHVDDRGPIRMPWDLVSKATFADRTLRVVVAEVADTWVDGTIVLIDRAAREFALPTKNVLTDVVHARVRGSVVRSAHIDAPAGAWVVLRKVAGRDGLTVQVRPDAGTDPAIQGFAAAVAHTAAALRGPVLE